MPKESKRFIVINLMNLISYIVFSPILLFNQNYLNGIVLGKNIPLVGANIQWINTNNGVTTDQNGEFL